MTSTSTWPPIWRTADVTTIMSNVKLLISLQKGSIVYFDFLSSVFRCQSTTHAIIHVRTSKFMEKVFVFSLYTRYSSWKLNVCLLLLLQQLAKGYFSIPIWCVCRLPLSIKSSVVHHQVGVISKHNCIQSLSGCGYGYSSVLLGMWLTWHFSFTTSSKIALPMLW